MQQYVNLITTYFLGGLCCFARSFNFSTVHSSRGLSSGLGIPLLWNQDKISDFLQLPVGYFESSWGKIALLWNQNPYHVYHSSKKIRIRQIDWDRMVIVEFINVKSLRQRPLLLYFNQSFITDKSNDKLNEGKRKSCNFGFKTTGNQRSLISTTGH